MPVSVNPAWIHVFLAGVNIIRFTPDNVPDIN